MKPLNYLKDDFEQALLTLDRTAAENIINEAVSNGNPIEVVSELVTEVLQKMGNSWEEGKVALSQIYMSGLICEESIEKFLPPSSPKRKSQPRMGIAVFEDYHLLGKRIIYSTLRASGYELMDLGNGATTSNLKKIVKEKKIEVLLLSTLMLPSALGIKKLTSELSGSGIKVIVGGAPFRFDSELWKEVGADAMGKDSSEALEIVKKYSGAQNG